MNTEEKAECKALYSTLKKKNIILYVQKTKEQNSYKWSWSPGKGRQKAKEQVEPHLTLSSVLVQQNGPLKARVIPLHGLSPSSFTRLLDTQNPPSSQLVSCDGLPGAWRAHGCWDLTIKTFSRGITWSVVWAVELGMQVWEQLAENSPRHGEEVQILVCWLPGRLCASMLSCSVVSDSLRPQGL